MSCPQELRVKYRDGRLIPFVGAGIPMSIKWKVGDDWKKGPSWKELVDQAARELGVENPELLRVRGTDLQILEFFKVKHAYQFAKLTNWLVKEMAPPDDALRSSPILKELAALDRCPLFYTTNFDDFLERSFALLGRVCKVIATEEDMGEHAGCQIVKFHGDLNHPDQMVVSESEYEKRLALTSAMDYKIRGDVLGRVVLFIGYSFRDSNVSYLFRLINDHLKSLPGAGTGRRAYITVSDPSEFERRLFQERNIEVIPIRFNKQAEDVAALLSELRG